MAEGKDESGRGPQGEGAQPAAASPAAKEGPKLREDGRAAWAPKEGSETAAQVAELRAKMKAGEITEEVFQKDMKDAWKAEQGVFKRFGERTAQNWSHSGTGMKFARGAGTAIGVILVGKGVKDLFSSKEPGVNGEEGPSKLGALVKTAGGAALAIFSLAKGGEARALRI